ncbi:MAG: c-type cytochrome [Methylophilaceae bacterium]
MISNKLGQARLILSALVISGTMVFSGSAAAECKLVSTIDNSPLAIKVVDTDTPQAKEFLETCVNPYTKEYAADHAAAKPGRKVFTFNNCMGCHGGKLEGIMAPSLSKNTQGGQGAFDQKWAYAKNATDKGMFETIAGGSPGVSGGTMFHWHNQLPEHTGDGLTTDEILKVIAYIRTEYKGDGEKLWMK